MVNLCYKQLNFMDGLLKENYGLEWFWLTENNCEASAKKIIEHFVCRSRSTDASVDKMEDFQVVMRNFVYICTWENCQIKYFNFSFRFIAKFTPCSLFV